MEIEDGEIISILGPSGCGKTTLLNLILGITDADSGKIVFDGEDITDTAMEKRGFNIVFQDYALFPNLNVYAYIKERGYTIYMGKVTEADTFRIGNIGEIYEADILKLIDILKEFLSDK